MLIATIMLIVIYLLRKEIWRDLKAGFKKGFNQFNS